MAAARRETARARADAADAERAAAHERAVAASAAAAEVRVRLDGLQARLAEEETRGIARAARRSGGRRVDEDLSIDPPLRAAAEAALAGATRAYVVPADAIPGLATERGSLVVAERAAGPAAADDVRERRFREAVAGAGGGILDAAVRRDVTGAARRILARAAWLPDLAACLAIQAAVPPGWVAVTRDGGAIVTELGVVLGAPESVLERRSEAERLAGESAAAEAEVAKVRGIAVRLAGAAKEAADDFEIGAERREPGSRRPSRRRGGGTAGRAAARGRRSRECLARRPGRTPHGGPRTSPARGRCFGRERAGDRRSGRGGHTRRRRGAGRLGDPRDRAAGATRPTGRGVGDPRGHPARCGEPAGTSRSIDGDRGGTDGSRRSRCVRPRRARADPRRRARRAAGRDRDHGRRRGRGARGSARGGGGRCRGPRPPDRGRTRHDRRPRAPSRRRHDIACRGPRRARGSARSRGAARGDRGRARRSRRARGRGAGRRRRRAAGVGPHRGGA